MRRFLLPALVLFAVACGNDGASPDQSEWLTVLGRKKAATSPQATPADRQAYADSLAAFVRKNPQHSRGREVYQHIQIDFAHELASLGRYQDAIRFYRAVLSHDPTNQQALDGLTSAADHLAVSRAKLLSLEKGMSQREVAHLLGKPIPGWTVTNDRRDATIESWYYRRTGGGIAGVYFRDGKLFAAEENSQARLTPLQ